MKMLAERPTEAASQAAVRASNQERNRKAWNLPRAPLLTASERRHRDGLDWGQLQRPLPPVNSPTRLRGDRGVRRLQTVAASRSARCGPERRPVARRVGSRGRHDVTTLSLLSRRLYSDDSPRRALAAPWSRSDEISSSTLPRRIASYTASQ